MMRTHRAGDLRAEHVGDAVVVCGWVAHRRDHGGVVFLDVRDTAGLVQVVVDPEQAGLRGRAPCPQRVGAAGRGRRCGRGPRARSTRSCRPARSRSAATLGRGVERGRAAAVPARRARRHRRGAAPALSLPRPAPCADAAQPPRARRGQPRDARGDARAGLRRGRDADADRVDAGGRARLRGAVAAAARLVLRVARRARSSSSSC